MTIQRRARVPIKSVCAARSVLVNVYMTWHSLLLALSVCVYCVCVRRVCVSVHVCALLRKAEGKNAQYRNENQIVTTDSKCTKLFCHITFCPVPYHSHRLPTIPYSTSIRTTLSWQSHAIIHNRSPCMLDVDMLLRMVEVHTYVASLMNHAPCCVGIYMRCTRWAMV